MEDAHTNYKTYIEGSLLSKLKYESIKEPDVPMQEESNEGLHLTSLRTHPRLLHLLFSASTWLPGVIPIPKLIFKSNARRILFDFRSRE